MIKGKMQSLSCTRSEPTLRELFGTVWCFQRYGYVLQASGRVRCLWHAGNKISILSFCLVEI